MTTHDQQYYAQYYAENREKCIAKSAAYQASWTPEQKRSAYDRKNAARRVKEANRNGRNEPRFEIRHKRDGAPVTHECKFCHKAIPAGHTYCNSECMIAEFARAYPLKEKK